MYKLTYVLLLQWRLHSSVYCGTSSSVCQKHRRLVQK